MLSLTIPGNPIRKLKRKWPRDFKPIKKYINIKIL
jgi:hypothetical protein